MTSPVNPPHETGPRNGDLPAYVSNGLVGLRVREQPLQAGMATVSGFAGEHQERRIEASAPAPYPLAGDLAIDGVWLSDQPSAVSDLSQAYDFALGELVSRFHYTAAGVTAEVEVTTFASRSAPTLVLQEVEVRVDRACKVAVRAEVRIAGLRGRVARRRIETPGEPEAIGDGALLWESDGALGACGLALGSEVSGGSAPTRTVRPWDLSGPLCAEYRTTARKDRPVRLRQIAALVPSVIHDRPDEEALRRLARGLKTGFEALRARNRAAWEEIWKSRITVRGASADHQALIDAGVFYLNSSTHSGSPASTSIFGLAAWHDYHYYYGHVMWDVDAFCVPPLMMMQPDAARAILAFRSRGLDAARTNAQLSGRRGLQFPWEAGPLSGRESAPGGGDAAAHEDHGSLHVARAFGLFADVTDDPLFLRQEAWPVLRGVADWIVSRVTHTGRGYEIQRATGPAEVPEPPDNDAFTLMAAGEVLRRALRAADQIGEPAPLAWSRVLADLYLPLRSDGVIAAHDDFRVSEPKGATPSPLAGLFPYNHPCSPAVQRKTLDFYLAHWADYVGAPMFPALYATWATMAGDRDLALKLFAEGYAAYDRGRFHQCLEYRPDHPDSQVAAGPFFANLGGMLLGLIFGMTGLVIDDGDPQTWARRPVCLPTGWDAIEIERLWIRGRPMKLVARHGSERADLSEAA